MNKNEKPSQFFEAIIDGVLQLIVEGLCHISF